MRTTEDLAAIAAEAYEVVKAEPAGGRGSAVVAGGGGINNGE
jgi:hypothetical protein